MITQPSHDDLLAADDALRRESAEMVKAIAERADLLFALRICPDCAEPLSAHEGSCPPDAQAQEEEQQRRMKS